MSFLESLRGAYDSVSRAVRTAGTEVAEATEAVVDTATDVGHSGASAWEAVTDYASRLGSTSVDACRGRAPIERGLTSAELDVLKTQLFGDSVDFSKVRITEGDDIATSLADGRPVTIGNTIHVPTDRLPVDTGLLMHEMVHVWQYQNGGSDYAPKALWAQNFGDGYDFKKGIDEGKSWSELNPEQQGKLLQKAQEAGAFDSPDRTFIHVEYDDAGNELSRTDYTGFLKHALEELRAGRGAP